MECVGFVLCASLPSHPTSAQVAFYRWLDAFKEIQGKWGQYRDDLGLVLLESLQPYSRATMQLGTDRVAVTTEAATVV